MQKRWRSSRIGVDLDSSSRFQLVKTIFNARYFFPNVKIEVLRTGHGYHIKIWKQHSLEQNFHVRRFLGDDNTRIFLDELRVRWGLTDWVDTLFNWKKHNGKVTCEEKAEALTLPFWSKLPCRKIRISD